MFPQCTKSPCWVASERGTVSSKLVPESFSVLIRIRPLIFSMFVRTMSSPNPRPESSVGESKVENPDSKIIFSPNTIYYKNDDQGHFECMRSIDVYNQHRNLIFYARETISYEYMKGIYNDVRLCPDMVLSLNMANDQILRCGCFI